MLAIPLISAKCKRIFSSTKHLITNSRNCFKANIIKANKCLKSQFRRPEAKAFTKGVDPNVNKQYREDYNVGDKDKDKDKDKDLGKDEDEDKEDLEGEAVKYTVLND